MSTLYFMCLISFWPQDNKLHRSLLLPHKVCIWVQLGDITHRRAHDLQDTALMTDRYRATKAGDDTEPRLYKLAFQVGDSAQW